ncbi:hypothetical protein AB0L80_02480 [Streptomyces sp. NPDC052069]|uniref:hypothetical protein n=1 Tax=Streptomyces sp. NPDC052069 TaxID=3154650 RepID=UPI00342AC01E
MSTNDQPAESNDDEPSVADYQRADMSKAPTSPAGQAAAIEGALAAGGYLPADSPQLADHNRRAAARSLDRGDGAVGRFQRQMLEIMNDFEQARRAEIIAAGGDPDEDRDPLEHVKWLADRYVESRDSPQDLERYLRGIANELTLEDARALRMAGEAVTKATPRLVRLAADEDGTDAPEIAAELGLTPSRVYDLLRRYVRYAWRADVEEADGAWSLLGTGDVVGERRELKEYDAGQRALQQVAPKAAGRRVRVLVWENPKASTEQDGTEETALYRHIERP